MQERHIHHVELNLQAAEPPLKLARAGCTKGKCVSRNLTAPPKGTDLQGTEGVKKILKDKSGDILYFLSLPTNPMKRPKPTMT